MKGFIIGLIIGVFIGGIAYAKTMKFLLINSNGTTIGTISNPIHVTNI